MRTKESTRRETLYLTGIMLYAVMILGTAGAYECGGITLAESAWQILTLLFGGLILCLGVYREETKAARKRIHTCWWTW